LANVELVLEAQSEFENIIGEIKFFTCSLRKKTNCRKEVEPIKELQN